MQMGKGKWHGGRKRVNVGTSPWPSAITTDRAGVRGRRADKARMAEGRAVRALKYQAQESVLGRRDKRGAGAGRGAGWLFLGRRLW